MRNFYVFFVVCATLISSCANSKSLFQLKSNVPSIKKITEYYYRPNNDSVLKKRDSIFSKRKLTYKKFTESGKIKESKVYSQEGELLKAIFSTFKANGEFLYTVEKDKNGEIKYKSYYNYNKKEGLFHFLVYEADSILFSEEYTRYKKNKLLKKTLYFHKHGDTINRFYNYNSDGKILEIKSVSNRNVFSYLDRYEYDARGYKSKIYTYLKEGESIQSFFDKKGNEIKTRKYKNGELLQESIIIYDDNNKEIERVTNKVKEKKIITYSDKWIYDMHKNWITNIMYIEGEISAIRERKIEYYE